jgi:hypothetical protein
MPDETVIYVELLDEGVDVWRPVTATNEGNGVYRLAAQQPTDERWAFPAGSRVRCELRTLEGTQQLVAYSAV